MTKVKSKKPKKPKIIRDIEKNPVPYAQLCETTGKNIKRSINGYKWRFVGRFIDADYSFLYMKKGQLYTKGYPF